MNRYSSQVLKLRRQAGLTLVELMVAMLLSLMLLSGVITVFQANKVTFYTQEGLAQLQENGRMALALISRDIRNAGYRGCNSRTSTFNSTLNDTTGYVWNMDNRVDGFEAVNASTFEDKDGNGINSSISTKTPAPSTADISDVLTIRFSDGDGARVTAQASSTSDLTVSGISGISPNDILMVSNCQDAVVFQATGINGNDIQHQASGSPGNTTNDLGNVFVDGDVSRVTVRTYYVATGAGGRPSLYRIEDNGAPQEVIEGIDNLQVLYGEDTDADNRVNNYVDANAVNDWEDVLALRITVLASSLNNNTTDDDNRQTYTFDGRTVLAANNDRRLRQAFSTTVTLRSMVP